MVSPGKRLGPKVLFGVSRQVKIGIVRIIAGTFKGQKLSVPRRHIRPTSERLRGSLFSALGDEMLAGSIWLDAFAGTGAVGIEALSRGAKHVVFNDRDRSAYKAVEDNLNRCGVTTGFSVLRKDVFVLLRNPPKVFSNRSLDILFLDPPYDFGRYHKLLKKALSSQVIDEKTLVILELFKKEKLDFIPPDLSIRQTFKAGDSHLLFLSHR